MDTINYTPPPLPDEILQLIFHHLSHNQKLIARLVHSNWNKQLMPLLGKTAVYRVDDAKSRQALIDSQISWSNLRLCRIYSLELPSVLRTNVTALYLEITEIQAEYFGYILIFPNVKKLSVCFPERCVPYNPNKQVICLPNQFRHFVKNLEFVSFNVNYGHLEHLIQLLKILNRAKILNLIQFELIETYPEMCTDTSLENSTETPTSTSLFSKIVDTISKSASKLKILRLEFHSGVIKNKVVAKILNKLNQFKELELQKAFISVGLDSTAAPTVPLTENISGQRKFLRSHEDSLTEFGFSLPWSTSADICEKIIQTIGVTPKIITQIDLLREQHLKNNELSFPEDFIRLKTMSIVSDKSSTMFNINGIDECPTIRRLQVLLMNGNATSTTATTKKKNKSPFFKNLSRTMTNLTELIIHESKSNPASKSDEHLLTDSDVQIIIKGFKGLKVLVIKQTRRITDLGITGTRSGDDSGNQLLQTRKLYLNSLEMKIHPSGGPHIGLPISSLKYLEKLELMNLAITDAGIYFGLRFCPSLRCLTLESHSENVTSWGLNCLAASNPGLDSFTGYFQKDRVSRSVEENMKKKLPLTQLTGKFNLILRGRRISEYDNSDSDSDYF